ncbi:hypothetical protein NMK71_09170 [Weeksellaceae bacterium KMM 9713]|uniref:Uncharacterized protein n=1 Tax=Profundicola chukchiensis TaxID=2961959 RepID=A0A9X4N431_9FLAO|nr:hypothetical protein [Profundicola chukchiensis]MDG4946584.1 hypothetical protein [Profundicola chukchiensis]MDG4950609.1 hypothetical protein [Profundicola chukchiensis]
MRKPFLYLALALSSCALINAQSVEELRSEIEALKQENQILQNKADFCDLYSKSDEITVKSFHKDYEMKVIEVKGNKNDQTVEVIFTMKHQLPNQKVDSGTPLIQAYDEMGKSYPVKSLFNSRFKYVNLDVPYNQLLQNSIVFRNVLPNIDRLSKIVGTITTSNLDGGDNKHKANFEFLNLVIDWE